MSVASDIAIVIPTMNRSEFVARQLAYYAGLGCQQAVYVGDSSQGEHWDRTAQVVEQLKDRINVVHAPLPDHNDTEAIMALLRLATERYAVFSGDDDFLVPGSLELCARYLDSHPEVSLAHGMNSSFRLDVPGPYGRIVTGGTQYGARTVEQETAAERLKVYYSQAFSTNFSLQRREDFLSTMEQTYGMPDRLFREHLPNALRVIIGKAKRLDCFFLVRQSLGPNERPLTDDYEWITHPEWHNSFQRFRGVLAGALAKQDEIEIEEALAVVKEAFWAHMVNRLSAQWRSKYAPRASGRIVHVRSFARRFRLMRAAWRSIRAVRSPSVRETYLEELLSRSSPYHVDFMPIYRAIAAPSSLLTGSSLNRAGLEPATPQSGGRTT